MRSSSPQHDPRQDPSPLSHRSVNAPSSNHANGLRKKDKSNNKAANRNITMEFSDDDANGQVDGDENADFFAQDQNGFDPGSDTGENVAAVDQDLSNHVEPEENLDADSPSVVASDSRKTKQTQPTTSSKGKKKKNTARNEDDNNNRAEPATQQSTTQKDSKSKRKRPDRSTRSEEVNNNDNEDTASKRPSKKPKTSNQGQESKAPLDPELDKVVENYANRTGPLKGRSLYILKREVPSEGGTTHTRSGRASVRPLAYWRNERCVYGNEQAAEGQRFPLSTIKEVIRMEEPEPQKKKTSKRSTSSRKSKSKKSKEQESEDEDPEYLDPWEKEDGVLHGYVRKWDPEAQTGIDEEEVLGMYSWSLFLFFFPTSQASLLICAL